MEFIERKLYTYKVIAGMIAREVADVSCHVIGITGTSSVGKSTFSRTLRKKITNLGYQVQVISADNYLKPEFRAGHHFWNRKDSTYLKPEHFDWEAIRLDLEKLKNGQSVTKECYVRGTGWGPIQTVEPSQIYIIEGLFLDSVLTSKSLDFDLLISLTAKDGFIRSLRIRRDAYYRRISETFTRTEEETLREIENTLRAAKSYTPCNSWRYHLVLRVQKAFHATIERKS